MPFRGYYGGIQSKLCELTLSSAQQPAALSTRTPFDSLGDQQAPPHPDPTPKPKPSPNPNPSPRPNQDFRAYRIAYKAILRLEGFCRSWEIRRAYAEVKAASLVIARYARTYLAHQKFLEFREEEGLRTEVEEGPRT